MGSELKNLGCICIIVMCIEYVQQHIELKLVFDGKTCFRLFNELAHQIKICAAGWPPDHAEFSFITK